MLNLLFCFFADKGTVLSSYFLQGTSPSVSRSRPNPFYDEPVMQET